MPTELARALSTHRYPRLLYRFPRLIRGLHLAVGATTLRTWYVRRALGQAFARLEHPFHYVDAGCGAGDFLLPYARRFPRSRFLGVDRLPGNVALCDAYRRTAGLRNVTLAEADLEAFVPEPPVDLIACITVLQYTADDRAVLRNFHRGLARDGQLLLYVPVYHERFFPWFERFVARHLGTAHYDVAQGRQHTYRPEIVRERLAEAGFRVTEATYTYGKAGQISYELHTLLLLALSRVPFLLRLLFAPLALALYPTLLLLMAADYLTPHRRGNGLLVVAEKR